MSSDRSYPVFQHYGTAAERGAFSPSPPSTGQPIYIWYETDTGFTWLYDTSWHQIASGVGSYVRLAQTVTSASQATVDFTSISGAYSSLIVTYIAQNTNAGTSSDSIRLKVNNDGTAANYTSTTRMGSQNATSTPGPAIASTTAGAWIGDIPNAGNTGITVTGELLLNGYALTTFNKSFISRFHSESTSFLDLYQTGGRWKSTAAITRLTFGVDTGAFTDGSVFTLYGLL